MLRNKAQATMVRRYGSSCYVQSDEYQERLDSIMDKVRNTNMSRYGAPVYTQSDEYKQNVDDIQSRIIATKRQNGVLNTSIVEKHVKGFDDFESQYNKDTRYPYLCDFYDKDRDLFIEVNASWTHGHHWYNIEQDADTCEKWKEKSEESTYYANALDVFTKRDVEKRETARVNSLKYVTLWDSDGMDADLWLAMGMPIGKDWEREYSWLPYHHIPEDVDVSNMRLSWRSLSAIVKDAQRKVFYKRELELWNNNPLRNGKLGVAYEGCDINSELFEGYKKLYELIDGFKPVIHNNDSANQLVTTDADAVIICPPYKGIEVYSDNGAENLSDEEFAAWWSDVVKNCSFSNAKVFAVQTNQACRGVFEYALAEQGWTFKEELLFDNNQKSHFHRSNGNDKHEYESMLVFVR